MLILLSNIKIYLYFLLFLDIERARVIEILIFSNNNLSPDRQQTIIWNNGILGTNFSETLIKLHTIWLKNAIQNIVCEMAAILFRPQWVNQSERSLMVFTHYVCPDPPPIFSQLLSGDTFIYTRDQINSLLYENIYVCHLLDKHLSQTP